MTGVGKRANQSRREIGRAPQECLGSGDGVSGLVEQKLGAIAIGTGGPEESAGGLQKPMRPQKASVNRVHVVPRGNQCCLDCARTRSTSIQITRKVHKIVISDSGYIHAPRALRIANDDQFPGCRDQTLFLPMR